MTCKLRAVEDYLPKPGNSLSENKTNPRKAEPRDKEVTLFEPLDTALSGFLIYVGQEISFLSEVKLNWGSIIYT